MTFNEFLEKRPEDVKKAKACKTIEEFKKMVDDFGISYKGDAELHEAFDIVKNKLSNEDLDNIAGGAARKFKQEDLYYNKYNNSVLSEGSGKKV
jgi:arsenate reductase-like glutaredoxin family protein